MGSSRTAHRFTVFYQPDVSRLPDGLTRRGDINLLMLGDPGTAKSQLLKFVEKCSPIGVSGWGQLSPCVGYPVGNKASVSGHPWVLAQPGPTFSSFILSVVRMTERLCEKEGTTDRCGW